MLQEMIPTLPKSTLLNIFRVGTLLLPCLHLSMSLKYIPFLKEILNMHQALHNLTVQVSPAVHEIHIWAGELILQILMILLTLLVLHKTQRFMPLAVVAMPPGQARHIKQGVPLIAR